jgi:hypothetical protein
MVDKPENFNPTTYKFTMNDATNQVQNATAFSFVREPLTIDLRSAVEIASVTLIIGFFWGQFAHYLLNK